MAQHIKSYNELKELMEQDKPIVIDFWAPWCGPCQLMGPIFEEVGEELKDDFTFVKVNTQENPMIGQMFQIRSIPTISVVHQGSEYKRMVGFGGKDHLIQNLSMVKNAIA